MECERLAREANLLLGQAGSIEVSQIFKIITETTFDAAKIGRNPATAFWTAETERVLRSEHYTPPEEDLQSQRSASVDPYLAVVNRIYESHAKVDGWLRFLVSQHPSGSPGAIRLEALRNKLLGQKQAAEVAQDQLFRRLGDRRTGKDGRSVTEAWENCRSVLTKYHNAVKADFARIRSLVAEEWGKRTERPRAQKGARA
jgi:hypothetical protein